MELTFGKNTYAFKNDLKCLIDPQDENLFKDKRITYACGYALCENKGVHRIIMGVQDKDIHIDHINGNKLDNRRANLRTATPQQNSYNRKLNKNSTTNYTGVHFYKPLGKYMAYIKADGKRQHLGYFKELQDAYTAYVRASKALHGDFAPDRIKEEPGEPLEPQPKEYKTSQASRDYYQRNKADKQRKQVLRIIEKTGKIPKQSTIDKHKIKWSEIDELITAQ